MYSLRRYAARDISATLRNESLVLARTCCPDLSAEYLTARLSTYGGIAAIFEEERLVAFQLIDEFREGGERYVYLGPLFSQKHACVEMFCAIVGDLLADAEPFHLMAEVQNPLIALLFKTLLSTSSYPRLHPGAPPARIRRAAEAFARNLSHIHELDPRALQTRSPDATLFRPRRGCEQVVRWMESRGVALARGDSQAFVVSCRRSWLERSWLRWDLARGRRRLGDWSRWRPRMLRRFERAAAHV